MRKFNDLLAEVPTSFIKDAAIESPDEQQLEADFANMAFAFLQDRAGGLLPYLLGFEVVDREEDGSKAIGIFGFKIDEDYYYVPAFFTNGQVRGIDLLFSKRTNSFVPLRESWINYIINRQAIDLGDTVDNANQLRQDFESPDFDFVADPPTIKRGSDDLDITDVAIDGFNTWNEMQRVMVDSMQKDAEFQEAFASAVARLQGDTVVTENSNSGKLHDWLSKEAGLAGAEALVDVIGDNVKYANALLSFYPSVQELVGDIPVPAPQVKEAARLEVVTESRSGMADKDRQKLVRDGFAVLDRRGPGQKSEVFETDYIQTYCNPDQPGTYNLLLRSGSVVRAWVCDTPKGMVVVHPTKRFYFTADASALIVEGDPDPNGSSPYSAAGACNRMKPDRTYILVDDSGKASSPFSVRNVITENRRRTTVEVYWKCQIDHKARTNRDCGSYDSYEDIQCLQLAQHTGPLSMSGKKLVVPSNWKALELKTPYDFDEDAPSYDSEEYGAYRKRREEHAASARAFKPGDRLDMDELLEKRGLHSLTITNEPNDSDFYVSLGAFQEGPYSYKTASIRLVKDYGLDATMTAGLMREAETHNTTSRLIKFSEALTKSAQGVGGAVPTPPPTTMGYDAYSGVPIEYPNTAEVEGTSVGMPDTDYTLEGTKGLNMGGQSEAETDSGAMDAAIQAAELGQKHVFDHATIGGLSRLYDTSAVIDSYIPEMSKSLDRLGRILFIFYWKNEEFADRYGDEDMGEMEDLLRSVFKSFGDVLLKLKQKSVDVDAGVDALGM